MIVEEVIKIGGSLLADARHLDTALTTIADIARVRRVLVVPGGGPFADAVRALDRRVGLSDDAAHWMAILAMDQYAHVLADRWAAGVVVWDRDAAAAAHRAGRVPVLAPSQ